MSDEEDLFTIYRLYMSTVIFSHWEPKVKNGNPSQRWYIILQERYTCVSANRQRIKYIAKLEKCI